MGAEEVARGGGAVGMIDMSKQIRRKKRGHSNSGRAMSGSARRITGNTPISSSSI